MTDHKFTDEEIIKALEICPKAECWGDCEDMGCPAASRQGCRFYLRTDEDYEGVIQTEMLKDALDLIKRQREEIERVTIDMNVARLGMIAEHERLKTARAEAVKKFSDRLKTYYRTLNSRTSAALVEYHIDQILNEMIGEQP